MKIEIALVQANPIVGDVKGNLSRAKRAIEANRSSDLVVFPESYLSGYPADDLVLNSGFMNAISEALVDLAAYVRELRGPAVLIGAPEPGAVLPFNAAHFIEPDGSRRIVRKVNLPNEGPFDEVRTFASGDARGPIPFRGFRIGVAICEEMWHREVPARLAADLADVLLVVNGSPYTRGKHLGDRMAHARRRVEETRLPLIYANLVGGQDELVFDGASFALDPDGTRTFQGFSFIEGTYRLVLEKRPGEHASVRPVGDTATCATASELARWTPDPAATEFKDDYSACVLALRDYVSKSGFPGVVLGISGGADSALAAVMAVDALGKDNVVGLTMPSRHTSDLADAYAVAEGLGIKLVKAPIGEAVGQFETDIDAALLEGGFAKAEGVTLENLQARARMILLMAWSNRTGAMLVTTGNKSECSTGYSTLYGDMAGGFNPLKDLYKTDVWNLMRFRNLGRPAPWMKGPGKACIPEGVITKPPSAGLAIGQTDEAKLGPYPVLDAFLRRIVDEQVGALEALRRVETEDAAFWEKHWQDKYGDVDSWAGRFLTQAYASGVQRLVMGAEYKRRQAAPGPKVGPRAFGRDRRYPIVSAWR